MNKFMLLADKAIKEFKGGDIDSYLSKIAKENNLNKYEHQRLIEEYNVGAFLDRLSKGTQHEEFDVANPVAVSENVNSSTGPENLEKSASHKYSGSYTEDMFDVFSVVSQDDSVVSTGDLQKVAHASVDDYIYTSEEKWEEAEKARKDLIQNEKEWLDKIAKDDEYYSNVSRLTKIASEAPGLMKTAISVLCSAGKEDICIDMMENSKFSSSEVASSKAEELPSEAIEIISKIS